MQLNSKRKELKYTKWIFSMGKSYTLPKIQFSSIFRVLKTKCWEQKLGTKQIKIWWTHNCIWDGNGSVSIQWVNYIKKKEKRGERWFEQNKKHAWSENTGAISPRRWGWWGESLGCCIPPIWGKNIRKKVDFLKHDALNNIPIFSTQAHAQMSKLDYLHQAFKSSSNLSPEASSGDRAWQCGIKDDLLFCIYFSVGCMFLTISLNSFWKSFVKRWDVSQKTKERWKEEQT